MTIPMSYTPTGIQPIPHLMPPAQPSLLARFRAWRDRPSRAVLLADRNAAQARVAELTAAVAQVDHTECQAKTIAAVYVVDTDAREVIARWKAALEKADADRKESDHGWALALVGEEYWRTAYAEGITPASPVAAEAIIEPEVVGDDELDSWREAAAAVPIKEFHTGMTGSWNKDALRAAVESVTA